MFEPMRSEDLQPAPASAQSLSIFSMTGRSRIAAMIFSQP